MSFLECVEVYRDIEAERISADWRLREIKRLRD